MTDILKPGDLLGGRYALQSRIARGGMGDVWEARDEVLGRTVAAKVMRPDTQADPVFSARFKDEARHTAGLSHPNIAAVYDYGEQGGIAYLVMELVRGEPLNEIIARGPMAPDQVRSIAGQAALALQAAHDADVVHRDVKPANIMVTPDGRVKLTDFGIARATGGASHTMTGEVIGTPHYLSPEQALGRGATGSSDLYALGIVMYEMLTGTRPFDAGSPVATALQQVNDEPPPLPESVPADLRAIVASCLAKRPEDRPVSCAALAAELGMNVDPGTFVPAVAAGASSLGPGATEVFAYPQERHPQAAAYVDQSEYAGEPPEDERARRRGGVWWLIPLVILLGLGAYLAVSMMAANPATPSSSSSTQVTSSTITSTTTSPTSETSIPTESSTAPTTTTPPTTESSVPSTTSQPPTTTVSSTTPPVTTPASTPVPSVQQTPSPAQTAAGAARSVSP